jgi:hypothetical protein
MAGKSNRTGHATYGLRSAEDKLTLSAADGAVETGDRTRFVASLRPGS